MSSDIKTFEHWLRTEKGYSISTSQLYASSARSANRHKGTVTLGSSMLTWLQNRAHVLHQEWKAQGASSPEEVTQESEEEVPSPVPLKHPFRIEGNTAIFEIKSKGEIHEVLIDADRVQELLAHRWNLSYRQHRGKEKYKYVLRREENNDTRRAVFLQRVVLNAPLCTPTYFLNGNPLDCRSANLTMDRERLRKAPDQPVRAIATRDWKYKDKVYISKHALIRAEKLPELKLRTVCRRLEMGWSLERALSTPQKAPGRPRKPDLEEP